MPKQEEDGANKTKKKKIKEPPPPWVGKRMQGESNRAGRGAANAKRQMGAFVYQGSGKKHAKDASLSEVKCEKHTIAVQWCLAKNNHIQQKCQGLVDVWKDCKATWDAKEKATAQQQQRPARK